MEAFKVFCACPAGVLVNKRNSFFLGMAQQCRYCSCYSICQQFTFFLHFLNTTLRDLNTFIDVVSLPVDENKGETVLLTSASIKEKKKTGEKMLMAIKEVRPESTGLKIQRSGGGADCRDLGRGRRVAAVAVAAAVIFR
ncbi:hypothetical protein ACFE04_016284 [Oxalis oulophora]